MQEKMGSERSDIILQHSQLTKTGSGIDFLITIPSQSKGITIPQNRENIYLEFLYFTRDMSQISASSGFLFLLHYCIN